MARCRFVHSVQDRGGNCVQNARIDFYDPDSGLLATDIFAAAVGGVAVTFLETNNQGEITGYKATSGKLEIEVGDNSDTAFYPGAVGFKSWTPYRELIDVPPDVDEIIETSDVSSTPGADKVVQALPSGKAALGWMPTEVDNKLAETVSVIDPAYGAVGDGVTDDGAAIQLASDACNEGDTLLFPPGYDFYCETGITVDELTNVDMQSPLIFGGTGTGLTIGSVAVNAHSRTYRLRVLRSTQSDWSSEDDICAKLVNLNSCHVTIKRAENSTIPVQCIGDSLGFAYNEFHLERLGNGKYQLDLTNVNGGWCNQNEFHSGRLFVNSGVNETEERFGVRSTSQDGGYVNNNNNVLDVTSFEIRNDVAGGGVPVLMVHGHSNAVEDARDESNGEYFARVQNASQRNKFGVLFTPISHGIARIDEQGTNPSSITPGAGASLVIDEAKRLVFQSPHFVKTWCYYNGATEINVPGLGFGASGSGAIINRRIDISAAANYIEVLSTTHVGIFLDTKKVKRFVVSGDFETGFGGRLLVACFDSAGVRLTNLDAGDPYVQSQSNSTMFWSASYGGVYRSGSDSHESKYFVVGPDVASIFVSLSGGTAVLRLRSFQIHALDPGDVSHWSTFERANGLNQASTAPTAGTFERGRRLLIDNPVAGGFEGLIQVAAVPTQTWKGFGAIEA